jgi:uncharacterized membrane protein required for colicin V production
MMFEIVVALMVILVAAFWTYQGFFSSIIMFFETAIAAMVAFAFFEGVNALWAEHTGHGLGLPLALMVLFVATLLALRTATDRLIPDDMRVPLPVDRAGGAVFGLLTGLMLIGMALISIQMLPIGSSVFGFERYTLNKQGELEENSLSFLSPDEFTAGMVSMLANDRFGGDQPLGHAKPDLVKGLYSGRAAPQSEARVFLKSGDLTVTNYWESRQIDHVTQTLNGGTMVRKFETREVPGVNTKYFVCAIGVDEGAAKKGQQEIRFRPAQFRIIGPPPGPDGKFAKPPHVYLASGMSDIYTHKGHGPAVVENKQRDRLVAFHPTTDFILGPGATSVIKDKDKYKFDVAFEVPESFEPWYVEFKNGARADLTILDKKTNGKETPGWASRPLGATGGKSGLVSRDKPKVGEAPGGRLQIANAIEDRTGFSDLLPIPLDANNDKVKQHASGTKLRGGDKCHFHVDVNINITGVEIREFIVPNGKNMFQVGAEVVKAESMWGNAINFANRVTAQIRVKGDNDQDYFAIGQYAAAEIDGQWVFEIQYYPNSEVPERALSGKKATRVTKRVLLDAGKDKSKFGYLFIIDRGVKIVSFHSGSKKSQPLDFAPPS